MHAVYSIVANTCPQLCSLLLLNNSSYTTEPQGGGNTYTFPLYTVPPPPFVGIRTFYFSPRVVVPHSKREHNTIPAAVPILLGLNFLYSLSFRVRGKNLTLLHSAFSPT